MGFDYDLFVIGGGSGGVRAGRLAAEAGARVGLAEEDRMGGTCVIRGCVPKKMMVYASSVRVALEDARGYGWDIPEGRFDWPRFQAQMLAEVDRLEGIYRTNLGRAGVEIFDARATVADPHSVELSTGQRFSAKHILVAVGGAPFKPDLPGIEHAITSNEIFHLDMLPRRALVVGGGYIACEFACVLNGMGVAVTQFYRGEQILRGFDGEMRGHLAEAMR
ncbi:MAG: NADPH-glutathione reductase, partial [Alphaproteobacteria bacterium HGW-Alphaproteobacteria-2]